MKILFIILALPFICISQDFNAGIIGGFSTSQVSGDQLSGFNKIGPRVGVFVNRKINWYNLQLELQYISKGSKKIINNSNEYVDNLNYDFLNNYNFHLDYIGIPVLFSFDFKKRFKIELGHAINILINQKEEIDYYIENSRQVNRLESAIFISLVYKLSEKYSLNIRGSNSILPIRKHSSGEVYKLNRGQYNTVLCFSLYYKI